ncbi:MAG TPA: LytTR family DNA-binding domain-containing protein [Candidatus Acidoferrales bacterium]|nr:LytTR family DNA-binding domain-containing protein [Candidatus Acidoferrales bacterium]
MIVPTIRTIIADDEGLARTKLRVLLNSESGVNVVAECRDGKQTVAAVQSHKPDLLLLDVQMPDVDGFEVLKQIPAHEMPLVIFTTAFDHYAIRAFEAHALDYLLKPFNQERLHHALERVKTELLKSHEQTLRTRILDLLGEVKPDSPQLRRLVIRTAGRVVFLDLNEVDWIEAAANYVKLHVGKDSYLLREGIGHISSRLDPDRFVRIHRSSIVNVSRIRELQPCDSGEYIAVLRDGKELSCSRGCRPQLLRLIEGGL